MRIYILKQLNLITFNHIVLSHCALNYLTFKKFNNYFYMDNILCKTHKVCVLGQQDCFFNLIRMNSHRIAVVD